jgi:hypothetical protein
MNKTLALIFALALPCAAFGQQTVGTLNFVQSSAPAAPTSGVTGYANSRNELNWVFPTGPNFAVAPLSSGGILNPFSAPIQFGFTAQSATSFVYDDFQSPLYTTGTLLNGLVCPTGQTWSVSGAGVATTTISGNGFVTAESSISNTSYSFLNYGALIPEIKVGFVMKTPADFVPSQTVTFLVLIAAQDTSIQKMLHLQITPTTWAFQKTLSGGGGLVTLLAGTHQLQPGVQYTCGYTINWAAGTATVYPPMGLPQTCAADPDITTIAGQQGCWELTNPGTFGGHYNATINYASMGPTQGSKSVDSGYATHTADMGLVRGSDLLGLPVWHRVTFSIPSGTAAGWYTVAIGASAEGVRIHGTVAVSADDGTYYTRWLGYVDAVQTGTPTIITNWVSDNSGATQLRLSNLTSPPSAQLDVYLNGPASTPPKNVTVDIFGDSIPYNPAIGTSASPLGGTVTTTPITGQLAPLMAASNLATASMQSGVALAANASNGNTEPAIKWTNINTSNSVGAAIDAIRTGAGYAHSLRFWTAINGSGGTLTQAGYFDTSQNFFVTGIASAAGLALTGATFAGTVTLSSGAGTITSAAISTTSTVILTQVTASGTAGTYEPLVKAGSGSATVTGLATDNSTYNWRVIQ